MMLISRPLIFSFLVCRYHNDKMVNYDLQNGFSVSSIQSQPHHHSSNSKIQNHIRDSGATVGGGGGGGGAGSDGINSNLTNSIVSIPQTSYLTSPTTSILTIKEVSFKHVGNYTCAPSNARPTSITVHVLRGNVFYIFICKPFFPIFSFYIRVTLFVVVVVILKIKSKNYGLAIIRGCGRNFSTWKSLKRDENKNFIITHPNWINSEIRYSKSDRNIIIRRNRKLEKLVMFNI